MLIKSFSAYVLTVSVCALTACSTAHRAYQAPTSGEVAFLKVVASDGSPLPGNVFVSTFDQAENCRGRYFLQGIPFQMTQTSVTLSTAQIPAGKPFTLAVNAPVGGGFSGGFSFCAPMAMFTPSVGKYYTATVGLNQQSVCYLSISSANRPDASARESVPFIAKRFSNGLDEDSSFCKSE